MTPPDSAGFHTENWDSDAPKWEPSPEEQAASRYEPHRRGSINEGVSVEPVGSIEAADAGEMPLYDGAPIRYLNEGDDGFDEIRGAIDLINESGSPDIGPVDDKPPPSAPDSAVRQHDEEEDNDIAA
jgi:hypothetical protein